MDVFTELVIRVAIIISLTDTILYYVMQKRGMLNEVTWQFVAAVIIVTIVPIVISLWWCLIFRKPS